MFNRSKEKASDTPRLDVDRETLDLLEILDAEYLIVAPGEFALHSSRGVSSLGLLRGELLISAPILNLVRAVRRSKIYQEETLELPRGIAGAGNHDLLVRVSPLGRDGLIVILIFDDSEFRRLDAIRRDFVANISHELKTPIGALSILSEAVLEASDDPGSIKKFAQRMQVEAKRLSDLVQEIINLSRLQDDDPLKNAQQIDLLDLVSTAIDESELSAEKRKISINFKELNKCLVLGDRGQLAMAISNLVENALNYSPDGKSIGVTIREVDGLAEVVVSDQGIGIAQENLERIFERFYRVDPARSRETGGTGLGLSIVKHVASNHGGDVSVWSIKGEGSTFTIRIPKYLGSEISTEIKESTEISVDELERQK